ncbi:MAG: PA0069 family radical SAM protein [Leptospiraceae bacterium]|nr:PA0069 family radical SAM protein [Leptospiraceae bacterium]
MRIDLKNLNNRGAGLNMQGRFEKISYETFHDGWELEEEIQTHKTQVREEIANSILTTNDSPDIPFETSINPYRGCEHGCIYCYARPNHSYVNLSPGLDFESILFAKVNAAAILKKEFQRKNYIPKVIALGASTDPYQPIEKKFEITRNILKTCLSFQHPIGIVTKSSLVERDIDILQKLAEKNLVRVYISVTSLDNKLTRVLEPRTPTGARRLETIHKLSQALVPVGVMTAPIIPFLNDKEMEEILEKSNIMGAKTAGYVMLRLPYEVKELFKDWLDRNFPEKKSHIMNLIKSMRNGLENSKEFGERMTGTGNYAELIRNRFKLATRKLGMNKESKPLSLDQFRKLELGESLFDFIS